MCCKRGDLQGKPPSRFHLMDHRFSMTFYILHMALILHSSMKHRWSRETTYPKKFKVSKQKLLPSIFLVITIKRKIIVYLSQNSYYTTNLKNRLQIILNYVKLCYK
jgi:hypothetical protein